jgi:hypothetical protein
MNEEREKEIVLMKRFAILGLALVAVFAMTAATASAKKSGIKGPAPFTATSGLSKLSSTEILPEIECQKSKAVGALTSATKGEVTVTFEVCTDEGKKCGNVSAGTIKTNLLETTIGWIDKTKGQVGVSFIGKAGGETGKGAEVEFQCEGVSFAVRGAAMGRSTPTNTVATTGKVTLVGSGGNQEIEKFEGGPNQHLITESSLLAVGVGVKSAQNQVGEETFTEIETKKGKKTIKSPDPIELNTTGAQPEQGRCQPAKKAKYSDSSCTVLAPEPKPGKKTGTFEFNPIA